MKKDGLLNLELPDRYHDCSSWFDDEGMDSIPSLLDFIRCGRSMKEYDKLQRLYTIENMKKYAKEMEEKADLEEANNLIKEAIEEYNRL